MKIKHNLTLLQEFHLMLEDTLVSILLHFSVVKDVATSMAPGFSTHENIMDYMTKQCSDYQDDHWTFHHHSYKPYCKKGDCEDFRPWLRYG